MTAIEAAFKVLYEAGAPLNYREITNRVLAQSLWTTAGKTPWDTIHKTLSDDIKNRGSSSKFVHPGPGLFALNPEVTTVSPNFELPSPSETVEYDKASARLTFTAAAEHVLMESRSEEPMHYKVITERALPMIQTESRTPSATMYAAILSEIRRQEARGETARFVQHGRGMVGLSAWLPSEVAGIIEEKNREVRKALLDWARTVSPAEFETLVSELLVSMGFEDVELTSASGGDHGIDVRGTLVVGNSVRIRMAVQAKRWKHNVTSPIVQQVRGSLGTHEQGLIITTSDFSKGAKAEANRSNAAPVALMNGEKVAELLAEYEIGATIRSYKLFELDEQVVDGSV